MEYEQFDRRLARECAKAFSQSTGLGCTLSDKTGRAFDEYGYGCESCGMCAAAVPEVFRVVEHVSTVLALPEPGRIFRVLDAANGCPANAIQIKRD